MKKNPARNSCRVPAKLLGAGAGISRNFLLSFYSCNSWQEILDFPVSCKIKEIPYSRNLQLSSHVGGRICESALRESQSGWAHPAGWWDRLFLDFWWLAPARGSLARADSRRETGLQSVNASPDGARRALKTFKTWAPK